MLIDSIRTTFEVVKKAFPRVELVVESGAAHKEMIMDALLGYKNSDGAAVIQNWVQQRA